ncbi:uncharacterized protein LOC124437007 [Xenia sp. Carnegie-2017]|uniref:uncharacterized protein LOC124437007 n=1 Tax=Xenia sp. Carnegie-2017 TaxID=2897299 RepID=UPI001F047990|nr:uncharacterized protein LOC124437007 [Xenia sp. Carnegie-2017]XP_046842970.1 uncharacterized protein LOC124437007 [Xenia sp. Carnegie-2017]XP_046842971.1 uncharacterized protein LOC124437007 [Xenia sp. Carnegie-2017]
MDADLKETKTSGNLFDPTPQMREAKNLQIFNINGKGFLKMELNSDGGFTVTATGTVNDPYAKWTIHYLASVNESCQETFIENEKCSEDQGSPCVLHTKKLAESEDFILNGSKIDRIPAYLEKDHHSIGFRKCAKAWGSKIMRFSSLYDTDEKPLYIGFDKQGHSIPLNKVNPHSPDFQSLFEIQ